jgi:hypothetical protein
MNQLTTGPAVIEVRSQYQDDPVLVLLTLDHESLESPIYVVNNRRNIFSRGNTYIAFPMSIDLPTDGDEVPTARISISNVSRVICNALEGINTPPTLLIEIVLASSVDTVERSWDDFELSEVSWDALRITGTIQHRRMWDEMYPRYRVTPKDFPGLFP